MSWFTHFSWGINCFERIALCKNYHFATLFCPSGPNFKRHLYIYHVGLEWCQQGFQFSVEKSTDPLFSFSTFHMLWQPILMVSRPPHLPAEIVCELPILVNSKYILGNWFWPFALFLLRCLVSCCCWYDKLDLMIHPI